MMKLNLKHGDIAYRIIVNTVLQEKIKTLKYKISLPTLKMLHSNIALYTNRKIHYDSES